MTLAIYRTSERSSLLEKRALNLKFFIFRLLCLVSLTYSWLGIVSTRRVFYIRVRERENPRGYHTCISVNLALYRSTEYSILRCFGLREREYLGSYIAYRVLCSWFCVTIPNRFCGIWLRQISCVTSGFSTKLRESRNVIVIHYGRVGSSL